MAGMIFETYTYVHIYLCLREPFRTSFVEQSNICCFACKALLSLYIFVQDYDAPLSENGGYTPKYDRAAEMIAAYDPLASLLIKPPRPAIVPPVNYGQVSMTEIMDYDTLLSNVNPSTHVEQSYDLKAMEQLALNNGNGQSYGYVVYRKTVQNLQDGSTILIRGHVRDLLMLMINGKMVNEPIYRSIDLNKFGSFGPRDSNFTIDLTDVPIPDGQVAACVPECTLDFMVENLGRANFGQPHQFDQKKGLWQGNVLIDGQPIKDWTIMSLEFDGAWVSGYECQESADGYIPKI